MPHNLEHLANPSIDEGNEAYFWADAQSLDPKRQHQFVMDIQGIPAFIIKASSKPSIENGEITIDHINIQRYVKGKSKWSAITVSLDHHESTTGRNGYASHYKKNITLKQLSPLGEVLEEWQLEGAFITSANFGSLDWSTEEMVMIELTLRYDYAFYKPGIQLAPIADPGSQPRL